MRRRYIQDPVTLKLVPAEEYRRPRGFHLIQEDIEPFRSHVDGTVITSRKELREHNARNNVVCAGDVEGMVREAQKKKDAFYAGDESYDRKRRMDALKFAVDVHEAGRSKADIRQMVENYRKRND